MHVRIMCQVSGVISVRIVQRKLQITPFQISRLLFLDLPMKYLYGGIFLFCSPAFTTCFLVTFVSQNYFFQTHSFATDLTAKTHKQRGDELLKVAPRLVRPQLVALNTSAKIMFP